MSNTGKRRKFLENTMASSTAFSIVPGFVLGKTRVAQSDTLYVSALGIGGPESGVLRGQDETGKVKFVTLCEVNDRRASDSYKNVQKQKHTKTLERFKTNIFKKSMRLCSPDPVICTPLSQCLL